MKVRRFIDYLAAMTIVFSFSNNAHAAGDRRDVQQPRLSQPVCTTLYPESNSTDLATEHRLQQALDNCAVDEAVRLSPNSSGGVFTSGPLRIPSGVFLRLDAGTVLAASTNPKLYSLSTGQCGVIDHNGKGCQPFILIKNTLGGGIEGAGTIEGQGDKPIQGRNETWWHMARRAQSIPGGRQNAPRLIQVEHAKDIIFYGIRLHNAPNFHLFLDHVQGATLWGLKIDTPATARNTDGIDPASSEDVTITHSFIRTGDDNIAIKAGNGPTQHISITDNHFYSGHGMSIGSEVNSGVTDVLVDNLTLDGTTSGLRIKSNPQRGGKVTDIHYRNICMRNNEWPVTFDTHYSSSATGQAIPWYQNITLQNVYSSGNAAGTVVLRGYDAAHPLTVRMENVIFSPDVKWISAFTQLSRGEEGVRPLSLGEVSHLSTSSDSDGKSHTFCAAKWIPFPAG